MQLQVWQEKANTRNRINGKILGSTCVYEQPNICGNFSLSRNFTVLKSASRHTLRHLIRHWPLSVGCSLLSMPVFIRVNNHPSSWNALHLSLTWPQCTWCTYFRHRSSFVVFWRENERRKMEAHQHLFESGIQTKKHQAEDLFRVSGDVIEVSRHI